MTARPDLFVFLAGIVVIPCAFLLVPNSNDYADLRFRDGEVSDANVFTASIAGIAERGGSAGDMDPDSPLQRLAAAGFTGTLATMSRGEAKRRFTVEDHAAATRHVECRKDADVLDETPMAYKDIDAVMDAQSDLVDVVHTLRQVVCVKG